jgi:D-alanyl-D-alanine carboxypeptidase
MVLQVQTGTQPALAYDTPLTLDTPFRIASITKPFTAATILRLAEQGVIALDDAAQARLGTDTCEVLQAGGFRPDRITLRHLLAHTAGLADHTDTPGYLAGAFENPERIWTPLEQVRAGIALGGPLSAPGKAYHYSDTGYVLLGEVIERATGQPLGPAVRQTLDWSRFDLPSTWWEGMEAPPPGAAQRARQFVGGREITSIHPSIDAFGGGGLVMSVRDLARLTAALFEGRLFSSPGTLTEMVRPTGIAGSDEYRLGLSAMQAGDVQVFGHVGYWGTAAFHAPALGITAVGFVAERNDRAELIEALLRFLAASASEERGKL